MSELKAFELKVGKNLETDSPLVVGVDNKWNSRIMSCDEVYIKYEADKVIADLEDKLRAANEQIENIINSVSSIMLFQDRVNDNKCDELRHHKYKRCLAMADYCYTNLHCIMGHRLCSFADWKKEWFERWHNRWLKLAEKFKEAK